MKVITDKRVDDFIDNLSELDKGRILRYLDLFNKYGFSLTSKYLKKVGPNLWELRPGDIRLFLGLAGKIGAIVVVHGLRKKTQRTSKRELIKALTRLREY